MKPLLPQPVTLRRLLLIGGLLATTHAGAATLNVQVWGTNHGGCGSKADPCRSISHAVGLSKPGGRILVGPGRYSDTIYVDTNDSGQNLSRLKIESTAGPYATIIHAANSLDHVISVAPENVRIGGNGKGFTFRGSTGANAAGIRVFGDRCRLEGNRITGNNRGIIISSDSRCTVRKNVIEDNLGHGILCDSGSCSGSLITQNQITRNTLAGIYMENAIGVRVEKNVIKNNLNEGMYFDADSERGTIKDNVVENNAWDGIRLEDADGKLIRGNILSNNGSDGMQMSQSFLQKVIQVDNNIALSNTVTGMNVQGVDMGLQKNSAIQNGNEGFRVSSSGTFSKFDRNNSILNDCGIYNFSGSHGSVKYTNHHFVQIMPTCGPWSFDASSSTSTKPNPTKVNQARKLL